MRYRHSKVGVRCKMYDVCIYVSGLDSRSNFEEQPDIFMELR
jgi:hypothetical protein